MPSFESLSNENLSCSNSELTDKNKTCRRTRLINASAQQKMWRSISLDNRTSAKVHSSRIDSLIQNTNQVPKTTPQTLGNQEASENTSGRGAESATTTPTCKAAITSLEKARRNPSLGQKHQPRRLCLAEKGKALEENSQLVEGKKKKPGCRDKLHTRTSSSDIFMQ